MVSDPDHNFGLMLALEEEEKYSRMYFASSDYATASMRPKLEIVYSASPSSMLKVGEVSEKDLSKEEESIIIPNTDNVTVYPSLFDKTAGIYIEISDEQKVTATIYNTQGMPVANLVNETLSAGTYTYSFQPKTEKSELFLLQTVIGGNVYNTKLIKK